MRMIVNFIVKTLFPALIVTAGLAQQPSQTAHPSADKPRQASQTLRLAPGSVIPAELTKTIDAKKVKTGDNVEARVTQDLKADSGQVLVPKNTKLTGRVTEAQASTKEQKDSQIGIKFDHAHEKGGEEIPLPLSIQAIISQSMLNPGRADAGGANQAQPQQPASANPPTTPGSRTSGMGTEPASQAPSSPNTGNPDSAPSPPRIDAKTQGVLGISNLKLSATADPKVGSVISSEKGNVKLESGTLMLLKVDQ
jgi:hypothetical protein